MASEVCKVLLSVAATFSTQGNHIQAIKCLKAISLSSKAELPHIEAQNKLQLAKALLKHTHNISEAQAYLDQAVLVLGNIQSFYGLKCAVLSELAACHSYLGLPKLQKQACKKALAICHEGLQSAEGPELKRYVLHLYGCLAHAHITSDCPNEALVCYQEALQWAINMAATDAQVLLQLAITQHHMQTGEAALVEGSLREAAAAIAQLPIQDANGNSMQQLAELERSKIPTAQLKLHFVFLRVIWLLSRGETNQLQKDAAGGMKGSPTPVAEMEQLQQAACAQQWAYQWLPSNAIPALIKLLSAAIQRGQKVGVAQRLLVGCIRDLEAALTDHMVDLQAGAAALPPHLRATARPLLCLLCLALESSALMGVTRTELTVSAANIARIQALYAAFPGMLASFRPDLHTLSGCYAQATGQLDEAVAQFRAAGRCATTIQARHFAAINSALALLQSPRSDAPIAAMEALKQQGIYTEISTDLPHHMRAAALLASGSVLLEQGELREGKAHLTKALTLAHATLSNHQLISQVLLTLAPWQLQSGDVLGGQNMLQSSYLLAKGLKDLHSQVTTVGFLRDYYKLIGREDLLSKQCSYFTIKEADLQAAVEGARADEAQNAAIVGWGLAKEPPLKRQRTRTECR